MASSSTTSNSGDQRASRPYSRASLCRAGRRRADEYVFFFGHRESLGDTAVLSNWYRLSTPFVDSEGRQFPTNEHYMMYRKAVLFNDVEIADEILSVDTPAEAKNLGRQVRNFVDSTWLLNALSIVIDGCALKFNHCPHARSVLLATGDKILVEAAPRDRRWGIGMGKSNEKRLDPNTWRGQNLLGEALMTARDQIRNSITEK